MRHVQTSKLPTLHIHTKYLKDFQYIFILSAVFLCIICHYNRQQGRTSPSVDVNDISKCKRTYIRKCRVINNMCKGLVHTISDVDTFWEIIWNFSFNVDDQKGFFQLIYWSKVTLQVIWPYWDMLYIFSLITCLCMGMKPKMRGVVRTWDGSNGWSTNSKHRVNKGIQYFHRSVLDGFGNINSQWNLSEISQDWLLMKTFPIRWRVYLSHENVARDTVPFEWLRWKVKKLNLLFQQFNMFILFIW